MLAARCRAFLLLDIFRIALRQAFQQRLREMERISGRKVSAVWPGLPVVFP
jgi:hypothetical protein